MARTKLHGQKYILKDKVRAKSVTTIINDNLGWNKQILLDWTRRTLVGGDDPVLVMNEAGNIGTLVHIMIQGHLQGFDVDTRDFTRNQTEVAMVAFAGYLKWIEKNQFKPLMDKKGVPVCEIPLVNEELRVGGTIDCIGTMDDKMLVVDWKTSSGGPYPEMIIQLGAYTYMLEAAKPNAKIDGGLIMRFDKVDGKFHRHLISRRKLDAGAHVFKNLCNIAKQRAEL